MMNDEYPYTSQEFTDVQVIAMKDGTIFNCSKFILASIPVFKVCFEETKTDQIEIDEDKWIINSWLKTFHPGLKYTPNWNAISIRPEHIHGVLMLALKYEQDNMVFRICRQVRTRHELLTPDMVQTICKTNPLIHEFKMGEVIIKAMVDRTLPGDSYVAVSNDLLIRTICDLQKELCIQIHENVN
jgi:hypothetical protein